MAVGIALVAGIVIGWLIEWTIDWQYWRRGVAGFYETESQLRAELARSGTALLDANASLEQSQRELAAARAQLQAAKVRETELNRRVEALSSHGDAHSQSLPGDGISEESTNTVGAAGLEQPHDDLQQIEGIGPEYEQRMVDAGVKTFAQLARASADQIEAIVQPPAWQRIDYTSWQRQAKELAELATASGTNRGS